MEPSIVGLIGVGIMLLLLALEVPLAFAMGFVGLAGFTYFMSFEKAVSMAIITAYNNTTSYTLVTIPLFVLMGEVAFFAGVGKDLYAALYAWLWRLRGGLAMATVAACGAFGAICGSSPVTAATIGSIALPEMLRYKYHPRFAAGSIAASGTLGILIPPSIPMIIYGIMTEQSIGQLFVAGIFPGLMTAGIFMLMIYIRVKINPSLAPRGIAIPWKDRLNLTTKAWPVVSVFLLVIGGIYLGWFTPTEAAALGALGVFVAIKYQKRLTKEVFIKSLKESLHLSAMIMAIIIGGMFYTAFTVVAGLPELAQSVLGTLENKYVILFFIFMVYLILGCVMDIIGMMVFTLPMFFPVIVNLGFDPIWFGVMVTVICELALITPPVGVNCMVIKSISERQLTTQDVFIGIGWYFIMELIVICLLVIFPEIVLFLPNIMFGN